MNYSSMLFFKLEVDQRTMNYSPHCLMLVLSHKISLRENLN